MTSPFDPIPFGRVEPAFATALTPGCPNLLPQARRVAQMLDLFPLSPWQEYFLALSTEYEEGHPTDGGIVPKWPEVILSVPRHCGKTECIWCIKMTLRFLGLYRPTKGRPVLMAYHAQSATDAKMVWGPKIAPRVERSVWGRDVEFYYTGAAGDTHARLGGSGRQNFDGGKCSILANKPGAGRGASYDFIWFDECRELTDSSREADLIPGMNTSASKQIVVCSTMGTAKSSYFNSKVDVGRTLVAAERSGDRSERRVAYLEFGVGTRTDYDVDDERLWLDVHPGLGFFNFGLDDMRDRYHSYASDKTLGLDAFRNEYLNQRLDMRNVPAVPWAMLEAVEAERLDWAELGEYVVAGIHAAPESEYVSVTVAGQGRLKVVSPSDDELRSGQPVTVRIAVADLEIWIEDWLDAHPQVRLIHVMSGGEAEAALSGFRRRGVTVRTLQAADYRRACQTLKRDIVRERLTIERSQYLRYANAQAEAKEWGVAWSWVRKKEATTGMDELWSAAIAWDAWRSHADRQPMRVI